MPCIYKQRSDVQQIELWEKDGSIFLCLNGEIQFHSSLWREHNNAVARRSTLLCVKRDTARVFGGGTGLSTRLLLEMGFSKIDVFELDQAVVNLARTHPALLALNGDSFSDPRVSVHIADMLSMTDERLTEPVDMIANDATIFSSDDTGKRGVTLKQYEAAILRDIRASQVMSLRFDDIELAIWAPCASALRRLLTVFLKTHAPNKHAYCWTTRRKYLGVEETLVIYDATFEDCEKQFLINGAPPEKLR